MKIISVDCCMNCPWYRQFLYGNRCMLSKKSYEEENIIPDWCLLKDEK